MSARPVIGWDVGGAHVKAVRREAGGAISRVVHAPCPLWEDPGLLETLLDGLFTELGAADCDNALTMTGEVADAFPDRASGVAHIVEAFARRLPRARLRVYGGRAGWLPDPEQAPARAGDVGSANWFAAAAFAAAAIDSGVLVDIGSTTTDIVAFARGRPANAGYTDAERLRTEELVYSGAVRTPVCAIVDRVPFAGEWCGVAREVFATSGDVHVLASGLAIDARFGPGADGTGFEPEHCARRLARMIGCDAAEAPASRWRAVAGHVARAQVECLRAALERRLSALAPDAGAPLVLGAGIGRFLLEPLASRLGCAYRDFAALAGIAGTGWEGPAAECAPAAALSLLP